MFCPMPHWMRVEQMVAALVSGNNTTLSAEEAVRRAVLIIEEVDKESKKHRALKDAEEAREQEKRKARSEVQDREIKALNEEHHYVERMEKLAKQIHDLDEQRQAARKSKNSKLDIVLTEQVNFLSLSHREIVNEQSNAIQKIMNRLGEKE